MGNTLYGDYPIMNGVRKRTEDLNTLTFTQRKGGIAYGTRVLWRRNPHSKECQRALARMKGQPLKEGESLPVDRGKQGRYH